MKKILFFATAALALGACTSEEYTGDETLRQANENGPAISFNSGSNAITRASITGAEAAALLNKNFVVEGIKTVGTDKVEVFDNYNVNYTENTADKTASNTANWEYVAQTIIDNELEAANRRTAVSEQSIKYWDFAASQYDFWAYSLGGGNATVSSLAHDAALGNSAYTITGDKTALSKVYVSNLVTAYNPTVTGQPELGNEVNLTFRSLVSKVRVGLYETIPGYSIKGVQFYPSSANDAVATTTATLYASEGVFAPASGSSTYTVTFPKTGSSNVTDPDYNKAHVSYTTTETKDATVTFGTLSYGAKHKYEKTSGDIWLRINSAQPTWAVESGASAGDYSIVLPNESGAVLTLKVDYTLESTDGTGETITVHGATALVPSQFTQWKPNYAYTYLFKISDNGNGYTNPSVTDKEGLYPITLDAIVESSTDGTQETITTLATPTITTYSITSDVTTNNEYKTTDEIYVTASTNGTLEDMSGKATLYTVTKDGVTSFTEAEVLDALTAYSSETSGTYTGRNDITLTPVSGGLDLTKTEIPLVDGNKITGLTAGQVALIDNTKLSAGTYAFVYETTEGTGTPEVKFQAVKPASGTDVTSYYTDNNGTTQATGTADGNTTYYAKYTTTTNTYAIKVIKVVAGS
ncbi:MAG: membrane lipoprotein lipid attachment site-containing protein [Prevotella sp.]|nr:membrane lipoprotein lipid attachment site-containing protein [Prevotella sp.]